MYCYHCGKEIRNDSLFCQYCGTKVGELLEKEEDIEILDVTDEDDYLDEEDEIEIIEKSNKDPKEKKKKSEQAIGYILIVGVLAAIILMIVISSFQQGQGSGASLYGTWYRVENYANALGEELSFDEDGIFLEGTVEGRYSTEDGQLTLYYDALAGEYTYDYEIEDGKLYLYRKGNLKYVFSRDQKEIYDRDYDVEYYERGTDDADMSDESIEKDFDFEDEDIETVDETSYSIDDTLETIVDPAYVSINGSTEGNRKNGGWVTEQGDYNYYAIEGDIYEENMVTGEKCVLYESDAEDMVIQVMGNWIYFEANSRLYRISIDGCTGKKFDPILGNDIVVDWDVYDGNVYLIVRENVSASSYNYYLAITDWETDSYYKIFDIGDMKFDLERDENYQFPEFRDISCANVSYVYYRDAPFFVGIENEYAYFVRMESGEKEVGDAFVAYRVNLDDPSKVDEISWVNNKRQRYHSAYVLNESIYAFGHGTGFATPFREENYYDIIDFWNGNICTNWIPELEDYDIYGIANNVSEDGIFINLSSMTRIIGDEVEIIHSDSAQDICIAHNQVYYFSNGLYCRVNLDGTNWEPIDVASFICPSEMLVFD